jgi:hypothetical protein
MQPLYGRVLHVKHKMQKLQIFMGVRTEIIEIEGWPYAKDGRKCIKIIWLQQLDWFIPETHV